MMMSSRRLYVHAVALAALAAALLYALSHLSGHLEANGGLGWDGSGYAEVVQRGWSPGEPNAQIRPLITGINGIIDNAFFRDPITTFRASNLFYAGALAFFLTLLLHEAGASLAATYIFVINIAVCIATAKMFAFYPVLVDLGAYAFITAATYMVVRRKPLMTAVTCSLGVLAREFGLVPVLMGVWRSIEERAGWRTWTAFLLPVMVFLGVRVMVQAVTVGEASMTTMDSLLENVSMWADPRFWLFFGYFMITVFGGVSALLCATPVVTARALWRHRELLAALGPLIVITSLGSADLWRYLAYGIPAVAVLFAYVSRERPVSVTVWAIVSGTTLVTQRPWQFMNDKTYFRDWFPYYEFLSDAQADSAGFWSIWMWRFGALALCLLTMRFFLAFPARRPAAESQQLLTVV
jgi:hypothetical protein